MRVQVQVVVNGEERQAEEGQALTALLAALGVAPEHVAVEHNGEVLERADLGRVVLRAGDRLEIVRFVGGGRR